jgi:hypothetical protein
MTTDDTVPKSLPLPFVLTPEQMLAYVDKHWVMDRLVQDDVIVADLLDKTGTPQLRPPMARPSSSATTPPSSSVGPR